MNRTIAVIAVAAWSAVGCGPPPVMEVAPPATVMVHLNINADDSKGAKSRAINIVDVAADKQYNFPLSTLEGGPVDGQPMHAMLDPDRKRAWITVGGDDKVALRVVALTITWVMDTGPKLKVVATTEVIPANTANMAGKTTQQGHGLHFGKDDSFIYFSELNNNRIRVFDTKTNKMAGTPITNAVLKTPHGFYPNKAATKAVSTQYEFNGFDVGIWKLGTDGQPTFDKAITLVDGATKGAYTHTAWWIDDNRFFTNATQEKSQGDGTAEQSVWLVDATTGVAKVVIKAALPTAPTTGILEGVSDTVVAGGKLYVAEGNVEKMMPPGHLSIWNISNPLVPTFVKRLSAGAGGLPADFLDAHELDLTPDGKFVYIESFRSNHSIKVDVATNNVAKVLDSTNDLSLSHGLHSGWTSANQF